MENAGKTRTNHTVPGGVELSDPVKRVPLNLPSNMEQSSPISGAALLRRHSCSGRDTAFTIELRDLSARGRRFELLRWLPARRSEAPLHDC